MLKRVTWFTAGAAVGAAGTVAGYLRARELARRHLPESVQDAAGRAAARAEDEVRYLAGRTGDAVAEWRATGSEARQLRREAEQVLRRQLDDAGL